MRSEKYHSILQGRRSAARDEIDMEGYHEYDFARKGGHGSAARSRVEFEVDKGRIVHSAAFRRLQGKTQVIGVGERDFYRTRLTHSIEVAQLGRGLCKEVDREFDPDPDLVEVICLGHDLGHPPFGHSGEQFLNEQMKAEGGFGANPQNLRVVTVLEAKYLDSGLDLTRATLDGLVKYPELYDPAMDTVKFTYREDAELLGWIKDGIKQPNRIPVEGQLADWADQMAYSVNDIEDIVRAGLLDFAEMRIRAEAISDLACARLTRDAARRSESARCPQDITGAPAVVGLAGQLEELYTRPHKIRERKVNLKAWTSDTIKKLKDGCRIRDQGNDERSVRYKYGLSVSDDASAVAAVLKATAELLVFRHPRVTTLEAKGRYIIQALYRLLSECPELLPLDFQELIQSKEAGSKPRLVADFIAGMTDQYAFAYYKRLFQPDSGSFYEDV
jgi:dGTPase